MALPADVIRRRPDVLAAESMLKAAHSDVAVALAEYYPKIELGAAVGFDSNRMNTLGSPGSNFVQGAVGLKWRLFDFARIDAQVREARGAERESLMAYRAAVLRACSDVEVSFSELAQSRKRMSLAEAQRTSAQRRFETAVAAWKAGSLSYEDPLNPEQVVASLDTTVALERRDVALAIVAAARALGGPVDAPTARTN